MTQSHQFQNIEDRLLARRVLDTIVVCSRRTSTGLAFTPLVIEKLDDVNPETVCAMLLTLARLNVIELRPDGGLGRFTSGELAASPEGPQGSRLLWIRVLETKETL